MAKTDIKDKFIREPRKIDNVTQIVDLMETHNVTLSDIMDEWYIRRIGR